MFRARLWLLLRGVAPLSKKRRAVEKLESAARYLGTDTDRQTERQERSGDGEAISLLGGLAQAVLAESRARSKAMTAARLFFVGLWQLVLSFIFRWRVSRARINPNAQCPSCGARQGRIHFDASITWLDGSKGGVIHTCDIDAAVWAERCIFKADKWRIENYPDQNQGGSDIPIISKPQAVTTEQARRRTQPAFRVG